MKNRKKVALVGTSCTGKTTLCREITKDGDVLTVPEAARQFFLENSVRSSDRFSLAVQGAIQDRVVLNERQADQSVFAKIVCDRSVLDAAVYVLFGGDADGSNELLRKAVPHVAGYSTIVVLDPRDVPYVQDEIRIESPEDRMAIHFLFVDFLERNLIDYETLSGTVDQRLDRIRKWLL